MFSTTYSYLYKVGLLSVAIFLSACANQPQPSNPPNFNNAAIYINQVAFDIDAPKKAVIALPIDETASRFIVYQNSNVIFQGELISQPSFTEWGTGSHYYLADFSSVQRRGEFHVVVNTQKQQLVSSTFMITRGANFATSAASILNYFKDNRHVNPADQSVRIIETDKFVDMSGGWVNSSGDSSKSLSRLNETNFLVTQQGALTSWALAKSYSRLSNTYDKNNLTQKLAEEVIWGADYLHRSLDSAGYFYSDVFAIDGDDEVRFIAGFDPIEESYTTDYQAAFREGGGMAIAALVRAHELSNKTGVQGEYSAKQYLVDAERAFNHLQVNNVDYLDDGKENILDDYTALIAATELYRLTQKTKYLEAARQRAHNVNSRMTSQGWFISDDDQTPYYHGAEAGLPIIALVEYLAVERDRQIRIKTQRTIKLALDYQLALNSQVSNPFNLARQTFQFDFSDQSSTLAEGFFIPRNDIQNQNLQGENSRLTSLTVAAIWGGKFTHSQPTGAFGIDTMLASFAQSQVDWLLGNNPYNITMLYGFGINNPPQSKSAGKMLNGGVSNGITGTSLSVTGEGMTWAEGPESENWRWTEQSLNNAAWYLLAITAMAE